jgi:hypothetical protein
LSPSSRESLLSNLSKYEIDTLQDFAKELSVEHLLFPLEKYLNLDPNVHYNMLIELHKNENLNFNLKIQVGEILNEWKELNKLEQEFAETFNVTIYGNVY